MNYCTHCGRKLIKKIVNASNFIEEYPCRSYPAFNPNTGKENLMISYQCPKYNFLFGMNHDCFGKKIKEDQ